MKVLITGINGQLGKKVWDYSPSNVEILAPLKSDLNLEHYKDCKNYILDNKPDWIINCAAYTNVDKAETEKEIALKVNSMGPKAFVEALNETKGRILHISTDFVFDGKKGSPYSENDQTNPINQYGYTKANGEEHIMKNIKDINNAVILRTGWVIGPFGNNFLLTMLKLHEKNESIQVVCDQIGSPTSTNELAKVCWEIINIKKEKNIPLILHWSNSGVASWYDLAIAIGSIGLELGLLKQNANINPIKSSDLARQAKRPTYSILNTFKAQKELKIKPGYWRDELKEILIEIIKIKNHNI